MWSGDARRIAAGRQVEVYLEKLGQKEIADLSGIEAVQMGLVMQPAIAREVERRTGIETRCCVLGHLQRGGHTTPQDCILAARFADKAWKCIRDAQGGSGITALRWRPAG